MFASTCKLCYDSDPCSDTVRVDLGSPVMADGEQMATTLEEPKEEEAPIEATPLDLSAQLEVMSSPSEEERQAAQASEQNEEHAAAAAAAAMVEAEEQARIETEAQALLQEASSARLSLAEEQAEQRAAEVLLLQEEHVRQKESAEAAKKEHQKQLDEAEERRQQAQLEQDKEKLVAFLKIHGFSAVDARRKVKLFGYKYPLHSAVKANDPEMVRILMDAGADPAKTNSSGQTPGQLAAKVQKKASHSSVIKTLGGC